MTRACWRDTGRAGQRVNVIPWQEHDLPSSHLDRGFTFDAEQKSSRDDEVVGNQKGRLDQEGPAVLGEDIRVHAPWRREVRVKENASRQAHRPKHFRKRVNHCGHPQIWTNSQVIRSGDHSPKHSLLYIGRTDEVPTNRYLSSVHTWTDWPVVGSCFNN